LPLESVILSCFLREQGNGEREPRENRGIRERKPRENSQERKLRTLENEQ